jgi:hypothetical protein
VASSSSSYFIPPRVRQRPTGTQPRQSPSSMPVSHPVDRARSDPSPRRLVRCARSVAGHARCDASSEYHAGLACESLPCSRSLPLHCRRLELGYTRMGARLQLHTVSPLRRLWTYPQPGQVTLVSGEGATDFMLAGSRLVVHRCRECGCVALRGSRAGPPRITASARG